MASPHPHPKGDGLPAFPANQQAPGVNLSSTTRATDKDSGILKESHSAPREWNETNTNETTAFSTAEGRGPIRSAVPLSSMQQLLEQGESQQVAPQVENEPTELIITASKSLSVQPSPPQQLQAVQREVNETAGPSIKGNDTANATVPGPSHQPVEEDQPDRDIPTLMDSSSIYSTGLDVDSNPTEAEDNDVDSAIGASIYSSTYSTRSSLYDFVVENGRTYHRFKEGKYHLPNDELEKDRLDLQHHLCRLSFGSLYLAPIDNLEGGLHNVLDIATGTGIWAIEFAEQFPTAVVVGTDLSPIQPDYVPPNLHFEVDDAEDPWVFSHKFDYIHGRMLVTCFQSHLAVFKSAFTFLRPGGYIELQDASFPFLGADERWNGSAFQRWMGLLMDGAKAMGKDWNRVPRYKAYLEEIGFVDVVESRFNCPIGPWARGEKNKVLGVWGRANILQSLGALSMAILTKGLGMTVVEIELLLVDVRNDINRSGNESIHLYAPMYVVYGRKP